MAATITHLTASAGGDRKGKALKKLDNDPLQRFSEAKKWMCGIYDDIEKYVKEMSTFYSS
jgi:hypothetical protein